MATGVGPLPSYLSPWRLSEPQFLQSSGPRLNGTVAILARFQGANLEVAAHISKLLRPSGRNAFECLDLTCLGP